MKVELPEPAPLMEIETQPSATNEAMVPDDVTSAASDAKVPLQPQPLPDVPKSNIEYVSVTDETINKSMKSRSQELEEKRRAKREAKKWQRRLSAKSAADRARAEAERVLDLANQAKNKEGKEEDDCGSSIDSNISFSFGKSDEQRRQQRHPWHSYPRSRFFGRLYAASKIGSRIKALGQWHGIAFLKRTARHFGYI